MGSTVALLLLMVAVVAATLPAHALAAEVDGEQAGAAGAAPADPKEAGTDATTGRATTTDDALLEDALEDAAERSGSSLARGYKKMAQTILPLLVGFKATGMLTAAIAVTKLVLLKAVFLSTTALFIAGLLALKKFLSSGHPHDMGGAYTYQHHDLAHMPYLHSAGAELLESPVPQVTYIGGSYGLQSIPYSPSGASAAIAGADDIQGLYSSPNVAAASLSGAQVQQLQQQALLAHQLGNSTQANQLLQLSRRRLNAPQGVTVSSPYPYRPSRPEARPA